jgi:hypothetical protein
MVSTDAVKDHKYLAMLLMHFVESSVALINGLTLVIIALPLPCCKAPIFSSFKGSVVSLRLT